MKPRYESLVFGNPKDNLVAYLWKTYGLFQAWFLPLGEFLIIWRLFVELKNRAQI